MNQAAATYHQKTSYDRSKMGGHFLDWQNQPNVFKTYDGMEKVPMPRDMPLPQENLFDLYGDGCKNPRVDAFDLVELSKILLLTYTLTSQTRHPGGMFYFRSAASAGALYPTEIYVLANGIVDLDDGLYHFSIRDHALVKLRDGSLSSGSDEFIKGRPSNDSPLTFFMTAIFFRSAWKYRDRSYRYHLLDTGHVLENLDLSFRALGLKSENTFDFDDRSVNQLLGLDENREVALAVCRLKGKRDSRGALESRAVEDLSESVKNASRVSPREFEVPEVRRVHAAGNDRVSSKPDLEMSNFLGLVPESRVLIPRTSPPDASYLYPEAVFRRRSSRNFVAKALPVSHLGALLKVLSAVDCGGLKPYFSSICTGFLASGVESLEDGFYLMDDLSKGLGLVKPGSFTSVMSHICLDQEWMASASLHFLFMTQMASLEGAWGPRGYRYAMMIAGLMGERLYLGASALGLGCCGIGAFYDGEAAGLLGLNASSRVLYVVSLGITKALLKREPL